MRRNAPRKDTSLGIRAVFFDLGGVILRTEYQAPRQHLAERLGMEYEDLVRLVFESETSRKASVGAVSEEAHWETIARRLNRPQETDAIRSEFFAGDVVDRGLVDFIRSLRPRWKTGVISNAWSGMRDFLTVQKFEDAFDGLVMSAEVGVAKPKAEIYLLALEQLKVSPGEAVFVDDFIENVEGARAVGMSAIHFKEPETAIAQLKKLLEN
jgi:epoxide hydrolase-like predicted phosphatase